MMDQQTMAMLGITDPEASLSDLGIYSGAQQSAQQQAQQQANPATPKTQQQQYEDLWNAKYGAPTTGVQGIPNEFGQETFPLPENMPLTVNTGPGGAPEYNPDMGEILGFSPDGQVMTTKTHPYLKNLVAPFRGSGNGGDGGDGDGGDGGDGGV